MRAKHLKAVLLSAFMVTSLSAPVLINLASVSETFGLPPGWADHIVISEFATRGPSGAYDEFVELYNPTDQDVDIEGWKLQYALTTWATRATIGPTDNKTIPARGFYLLANPAGYSGDVPPDKWWDDTTGFADDNRSIRIVDAFGKVVDMVGYGPRDRFYEGSPGPAHLTSPKSVERRPGYLEPYAGNGVDTDNNAADFIVRDAREPQNTSSPREPQDYGVTISISPVGKIGSPGETLTYTITVMNVGTIGDNYSLSAVDTQSWSPSVSPSTLSVPAGENRTATLSVTIPGDASIGVVDNITVTASSPNASDSEGAAAATPGVWIVASYSPKILNYAVAVVGAGENIYIANSDTAVPTNNSFMRYNTTTGEWSYLSTPPDAFKNGTCLAWDSGGNIYALLGGSYTDIGTSARHYFYRYSISANTWTKLENTPDAGGQGAGDAMIRVPGSALGIDDNYIYAIVGSADHGTSFWRYSVRNNTWQSAPFHPSWSTTDDGASLVWAGGEYLYALRGEYIEATPCQDFARFRLTDNTWENGAMIPDYGGVGDGGSLLWIGGDFADYVYALGGSDCWENPGDDFYAYKIVENLWVQLADLPAGVGDQNGPRLGLADGNIYAWRGGYNDPVLWVYGPMEVPNELRLAPTDDSYVHESRPDVNFGTYTTIFAGRYTYGGVPGAERGFLKFDLSAIPAGMNIVEARLYLYCWRVDNGGADVQVQAVHDDSWSEGAVTWNNQPVLGAILDGPRSASAEGWYSWAVTGFLAEQYAGDKIASFALIDAGENVGPDHAARFDSKEYGDSGLHPYLKITYTTLYGVSVDTSPGYQDALPGMTLEYTVTVRNVGAFDDNYTLTATDDAGWSPSVTPSTLAVPAGENRTATLSVTIPYAAATCTKDNITVTATSVSDPSVSDSSTCAAHVASWKAEFRLVTLYKISLDVDLYLGTGSRLLVKFYTYGNSYENENVFWSGTTPAYVAKFDNIPHPRDNGVKKAKLVLTDDGGSEISTLASFVVTRGVLWGRILEIKQRWPFAGVDERGTLWAETLAIKSQWPFAPA